MISDKQRRWAYRQWLGLPESVKEPTIYQVLGIEPFEEDQTVIRNAIEQRRAFVQSKRGQNKNSDLIAVALLGEIDDAAAIVFAPELRHQYNQANSIRKRPINPRARSSKGTRSRFWSIFATHRSENDYVDGSGFLSTFLAIMAVIVASFLLILLAAWYHPSFRLSKTSAHSVASEPLQSSVEFGDARSTTSDTTISDTTMSSGTAESDASTETDLPPVVAPEAATVDDPVPPNITPANSVTAKIESDVPTPAIPTPSTRVGSVATVLRGHHAMVNSLDISADGRWAVTGAHDGWVYMWDLNAGKKVWGKELESDFPYEKPNKGVSIKAVSFGDSSDAFFAATRFHIHEVRRESGQITRSSSKFAKQPTHVTFSPNASVAAINSPKEFAFFDVSKMKQNGKVNREFASGVALSRQGNFFVGSFEGNDQNFLGRIRDGKVEQTLSGLSPRVEDATFSDDGRRIAATTGTGPAEWIRAGQGRVAVWELRGSTWEKSKEWTAEGWQWSVCFSHDGKLIATGGYGKETDWFGFAEPNKSKNQITIWDAATGSQLARSGVHDAAILNLEFTPDNKRLVTVSGDSKVRVWKVADLINDHD